MTSERRKFPRTGLNLPVEVQGYSCENGAFVEHTQTFNVSPLGVSFRLQHPVVVDDILRLTLPMPAKLRLFDLDLPQYQIYSQVRRTRHWPDGRLIIGVAFISKDPPDLTPPQFEQPVSYDEPDSSAPQTAPTDSAKLVGPLETSAARADQPLKHPTIAAQKFILNNDRIEPRAKLRFSLSIRGLDKHGQNFVELVQTEDVSKHGLCFFTSKRELEANSIVELIGFQGKFSAQGEVRHINYNSEEKNYRVGLRLLGEPNNWIVK